MLEHVKTGDVLFMDIETVPQYPYFEDSPEKYQRLWEKKAKTLRDKTDETTPAELYQRAGIYAEFGKIICISAGMVVQRGNEKVLRIKSFFGNDEKQLLSDFSGMLIKLGSKKEVIFCAHNGKEFDYPYLARRILINGLDLPVQLNFAGKKPWEVAHLDTLDLWKFGDYKSYTSLDLLTFVFGIESPKQDIDGSMVASVYWNKRDLKRIVDYCEADMFAVVKLFMRFKNEEPIKPENVERITND
jgi:DNA polymerase elongation subunit (family B)